MQSITRRQLVVLVVLTLIWGINWPIMKAGVTGYPPLTFRAQSMWIGLPLLALVLASAKVSFKVPRAYWPELALLAVTNMMVWHVMAIVAIPQLSSGRAAILAYTMPVFAALIGALFFGTRLGARAWGGVLAATVGVVLLLWHELHNLSGSPVAVLMMLAGACVWALGTHLLRRTRIPVHVLTLAFWFTVLTLVAVTLLALVFEPRRWSMPRPVTMAAIVYNAVLVFGFAQAAWFYLARGLPATASSLSVMFIPVLGVLTGAVALDEVLHWQDWAAMVLMAVAIASVLLPSRSGSPQAGAETPETRGAAS